MQTTANNFENTDEVRREPLTLLDVTEIVSNLCFSQVLAVQILQECCCLSKQMAETLTEKESFAILPFITDFLRIH